MKFFVLLSGFLFVSLFACGQVPPSGSIPDIDVYSLQSCDRLFSSCKSVPEKEEMQKQYWTLLGILQEMGSYRADFITNGTRVNFFPTVYYHVTLNEMKRIADLQFVYPIEKMKQMVGFYNAYKWNRQQWENSKFDDVEPHWAKHFELVKKHGYVLPDNADDGIAMMYAIDGHVRCDLPRAIRYAYQHRFNRSVSVEKLKQEFIATNDLFDVSMNLAIRDVMDKNLPALVAYIAKYMDGIARSAYDGMVAWLKDMLKEYPLVALLLDVNHIYDAADVIKLRQKSWELAFAGRPLKNPGGGLLMNQPVPDPGVWLSAGKSMCPPVEEIPPLPAPEGVVPLREAEASGNTKGLTGGATPDVLGRLLLKAIKANDRKLWISCIHPIAGSPENVAESFDRVRNRLEQEGVTDWNAIVFSRVTYSVEYPGWTHDKGVFQGGSTPKLQMFKGEQTRRLFKIEFTYRNNEFLGWIGDMPIMTYQHKNYLITSSAKAVLQRN